MVLVSGIRFSAQPALSRRFQGADAHNQQPSIGVSQQSVFGTNAVRYPKPAFISPVRFGQGYAGDFPEVPYGASVEWRNEGKRYQKTHFKLWAPKLPHVTLVRLKPLTIKQKRDYQEWWDLTSQERYVQALFDRVDQHENLGDWCHLSGRLYQVKNQIAQRKPYWDLPTLEERINLERPMENDGQGNFYCSSAKFKPGTLYAFKFPGIAEEEIRPDPRSHYQPEDVEGPSEVVDHRFEWGDWEHKLVKDPRQAVILQMHVGLFTDDPGSYDGQSGTFSSLVDQKLGHLTDLGVTHVEPLPFTEFPGMFGFGYNPAFHFSVERAYGSPKSLKQTVNTLGENGIGMIADGVYNHSAGHGFWPHSYDNDFITQGGQWGGSLNYSHDPLRMYVVDSIQFWRDVYRMQGMRFDMAEKVRQRDYSAAQALTYAAHEGERVPGMTQKLTHEPYRHRSMWTFSEDGEESELITLPREHDGVGFDGQWSFEFRHIIAAMLNDPTPERVSWALRVLERGFKQGHMNDRARGVNFLYTHDVLHNGEGSRMTEPDMAKLANAMVLLSPGIPMLFMGQEYGETRPMHFFGNPISSDTIRGTIEGRGDNPDDMFLKHNNFTRSKLSWNTKAGILNFTKDLINLRRTIPALWQGGAYDPNQPSHSEFRPFDQFAHRNVLVFSRRAREDRQGDGSDRVFVVVNLSDTHYHATGGAELKLPLPYGQWEEVINSASERYLDTEDADELRSEYHGDVWTNAHREGGLNVHDAIDLPAWSVAVFKKKAQ